MYEWVHGQQFSFSMATIARGGSIKSYCVVYGAIKGPHKVQQDFIFDALGNPIAKFYSRSVLHLIYRYVCKENTAKSTDSPLLLM